MTDVQKEICRTNRFRCFLVDYFTPKVIKFHHGVLVPILRYSNRQYKTTNNTVNPTIPYRKVLTIRLMNAKTSNKQKS